VSSLSSEAMIGAKYVCHRAVAKVLTLQDRK